MTLDEMALFVGSKVGKTDQDSLTLIKGWIRNRYQMIWDSAQWRDSLVLVSVAATGQEVILPAHIGRVVGVRWSDRELYPTDLQAVIADDPNAFDRAGTPALFAHLPPVATTTRIATAEMLSIAASAADTSVVVVRGEAANGSQLSESVTLNGSTPVLTVGTYAVALSISRAAGATTSLTVTGQTSATVYSTIPAQETSVWYPRIRMIEAPQDTSKTVLVLCKRKCDALRSDADSPSLRGVEGALLAYGMSDALEWLRQWQKAQLKLQEAAAQMDILRDNERTQQTTVSRIVPWMGDDARPWELT